MASFLYIDTWDIPCTFIIYLLLVLDQSVFIFALHYEIRSLKRLNFP